MGYAPNIRPLEPTRVITDANILDALAVLLLEGFSVEAVLSEFVLLCPAQIDFSALRLSQAALRILSRSIDFQREEGGATKAAVLTVPFDIIGLG